MPFCQRCTGLYVGGLLAITLFGMFRPRPTRTVLWFHGLLLLLMVPFGYHLMPQNGEVRTLTGQLFAAGLVYLLALNPAATVELWKRSRRRDFGAYLAGLCGCLVALQLAVRVGGSSTGAALSWLGFAGLVLIAVLALTNVMLLPSALWRVLRRRPG